jgi:hypothetical protein
MDRDVLVKPFCILGIIIAFASWWSVCWSIYFDRLTFELTSRILGISTLFVCIVAPCVAMFFMMYNVLRNNKAKAGVITLLIRLILLCLFFLPYIFILYVTWWESAMIELILLPCLLLYQCFIFVLLRENCVSS